MEKIKDLPPGERPREKLIEKGPKSLSDRELLAIILGRGTRNQDVLSIADKLITFIDQKSLNLSIPEFMTIDGIGQAKATALSAAFEFVRRRIRPEGLKIKGPVEVLPLIRHFCDRKQEHFISISLNGANEVMAIRVVTIGLVNKSQVHPREVFSDLIAERATALIIAHNHPSGDLTPSQEDKMVTRQIQKAGKILGIPLLDHIIFHTKGHYSFAAHDLL